MKKSNFEWDDKKNEANTKKHGVSFIEAERVFLDPDRIIVEDILHSKTERRLFCIGKIDDGIISVRFTHRGDKIRIIGAGYWRGGKKIYEKKD
jgi:uncharacterized DUF497 family protein